jgi:serine/threonine protein kinase
MQLKVCDFGLAVELKNYEEKRMSFCGHPLYMAPEVIENGRRGHSFEVDVWAFGIILYQLAVGTTPYTGDTAAKVNEAVMKQTWDFPKNVKVSP